MTNRLKPGGIRVFINGKQVPFAQAQVPVRALDRICAFESLKSYGGRVFRLREHIDRLYESARTAGIRMKKTRAELEREINLCLSQLNQQDAFLRFTADGDNSYLFVLERSRPAWIYTRGVDLRTIAVRRNLVHASPPETKANDFMNSVLAALEPAGQDIFDSVFLDTNGYVAEATIWNLFAVRRETLLTPASGILSGVTRQFVIECAFKENLAVIETNLTRHDFWNVQEAFLTNTSGEIVPIRSLDGRMIGRRRPGPVTRRLMRRFRKELEQENVKGEN